MAENPPPQKEILPQALTEREMLMYEGSLFIGFNEGELTGVFPDDEKRVKLASLADLRNIRMDVQKVFLAAPGDPKITRSMFLANDAERGRLLRNEALPHRLHKIAFPRSRHPALDDETCENLIADTDIPVACVNTAWPIRAQKNWLKRSIETQSPLQIGILGLGRIGFEAAKTLLVSAYLGQKTGSDFQMKALNIYDDKEKKGQIMELKHIANSEGVEINQCQNIDEVLNASDVVLFIASDAVPSLNITSEQQGDVRLMQFEYNLKILKHIVEIAKKVNFTGQLVVVSDPPEHLSTAVNSSIAQRVSVDPNSDEVIGNHQVPAMAGRLNWARALSIVRETRDQELLRKFLTDGMVFGPHGPGIVVADSVTEFDAVKSEELGKRLGSINYEVRKAGKLPFDAPGINLGLGIGELLRGETVPVSLNINGVTTGVSGRFDRQFGCYEAHAFYGADRALVDAVMQAVNGIRSTTEIFTGKDIETRIPMRTSAFWANGVITGQAVPVTIFPTCSGRNITNFRSVVIDSYHFPHEQGQIFLPENKDIADTVDSVMRYFRADYKVAQAPQSESSVKSDEPDIVSEPKEFAEKAAIVFISCVSNPDNFNLTSYRQRYPLYLEIEVDVSTPSNVALTERVIQSGGICMGFIPKTAAKPAHLNFGFMGDNVRIEESPEVPLLSSISGYDEVIAIFKNWQKCFKGIIEKAGESNCGKSHRQKKQEQGRAQVESDSIMHKILIEGAYYDKSPSLFGHVVDVTETAKDLVRILNVKDVDQDILGMLCMLHDLGKAVYLNLNHYVNACRLAAHPAPESDMDVNAWRFGVYKDALLAGKPITLPEELERFRKFIDSETGVVARDTQIAMDIIESNSTLKMMTVLRDKLIAFMREDADFEKDLYSLFVELADNLSDFGRMDNIDDIMKYLDFKEQYAVHRYGATDEIKKSIKAKFAKLKDSVKRFGG